MSSVTTKKVPKDSGVPKGKTTTTTKGYRSSDVKSGVTWKDTANFKTSNVKSITTKSNKTSDVQSGVKWKGITGTKTSDVKSGVKWKDTTDPSDAKKPQSSSVPAIIADDHEEPSTHNGHRPARRLSNVQAVEELMKTPVYDPEMCNPDGSIKAMYTMPSSEQRWEQANRARYIRTKNPMDRDRELTPKEIFEHL